MFFVYTNLEAGLIRKGKKADPNTSKKVLEEMIKKDKGLKAFKKKSVAYAVFPKVGKGGVGIGGAFGRGHLFVKNTAIGEVSLKQVSYGLQLGGQLYSEVIFFQTKEALETFKSGDFEFGAQLSAVAIKKGASANASFNNGMAIFTMAKGGLMYQASIGGQKFKFEKY